jgi:hypothetical protein
VSRIEKLKLAKLLSLALVLLGVLFIGLAHLYISGGGGGVAVDWDATLAGLWGAVEGSERGGVDPPTEDFWSIIAYGTA